MYCELVARYFLQYEVEPTEYSASFAFDRLRCFSRIVPVFPVIVPLSSITTTCISSNLPPLEAAYVEVLGLSAIASHSILSGLPFASVLVKTISCLSNQSTACV